MLQTGSGLPTLFIARGLGVAGSIVCGLLGERLRIRTVHTLRRTLQDRRASRLIGGKGFPALGPNRIGA
jgi:hypothetical protein